jgi:hypothetical protein
MYAKASASHNGGAFSCAAEFVSDKYTASLASVDKTSAMVAVTISNNAESTINTPGMTVSVDLVSLKITAVTCPN